MALYLSFALTLAFFMARLTTYVTVPSTPSVQATRKKRRPPRPTRPPRQEVQRRTTRPRQIQRCVRFAPASIQLYTLEASERQMKRDRYAQIRRHEKFFGDEQRFYLRLDAAAEGQRREELVNARAAAVMASIMDSSDDDYSEAWDELFLIPNVLQEDLIGMDVSMPSAGLGCPRQVSLLVETVLEGCDCSLLRPVMEGAIELFPDDFGTQTKLSLFVPLVLPSPQDSTEEQEVIAVPKKEIFQIGYFKHVALLAAAEGSRRALLRSSRRQCAACAAKIAVYQAFVRPILLRPAFSTHRIDLQAARSALRPIGELAEEDDIGLGDIDFEEDEEMSSVIFKTVSFDLEKNMAHDVISLYSYSDQEFDACFRSDEEREQSKRDRKKVIAKMNKSGSSTFSGGLYRGLERFTATGMEESMARVFAHCDGVLDENAQELRWVSERLSERSIALAIERATTDRAEAEKVYAEGKKGKPRRISGRQGTRASERLAARGLGSAFTLSGRRFSNRLANTVKLV
jgi:hypothetical protein